MPIAISIPPPIKNIRLVIAARMICLLRLSARRYGIMPKSGLPASKFACTHRRAPALQRPSVNLDACGAFFKTWG